MQFRILGPLEVRRERRGVAGGGKPRAILALLLLHPNEPVSADRVAVELWGDDAPAGVVEAGPRARLTAAQGARRSARSWTTTPAGYRLRVRPGELDADRFERLLGDGRRRGGGRAAEDAADLLREALSLVARPCRLRTWPSSRSRRPRSRDWRSIS